jgi:hypothetical protein
MLSLLLFRIKERIERTEAELRRQTNGRYLAQSQLTKANAALEEMGRDLEAANRATAEADAEAVSQKKKAKELTGALAASQTEADQARTELARYQYIGLEPQEIAHVAAQLKSLQTALAVLEKQNSLLKQQITFQTKQAADGCVPLPAGLQAKVMRYDPKWHFVVLDAGAEQGMLKNAELLIGREGRFVGKIKISSVENEQSIGNLVSGWQLGEIVEGDFVIPAFVCQN